VATASGRPELADIFRTHGHRLEGLLPRQRRVAQAIVDCRTAALGGHVRACDRCGHQEISYNSCRNRHCPKCQSLERVRWQEAREQALLPVPYFHTVFTIPSALHAIFLANVRQAYGLLFRAVARTLSEVAADPRNLGAQIGFTAVLHTWTQTLLYHPHIHGIVAGGGLAPDGTRWIAARPDFFVSVRVLSAVFRAKLLALLEEALAEERIVAPSGTSPRGLLRRAARRKWVVYCKAPFAGPKQVLAYLGRYTHRIAIGNERLHSMQDGKVTFRYRDREHGNRQETLTLPAEDFLRRFLLHVLPDRFVRVRHYGLLANGVVAQRLARCRELLGMAAVKAPDPEEEQESWQDLLLRLTGRDVKTCPTCRMGRMEIIEDLEPQRHRSVPRPCAASP
jgi:hypothetical protein